MLTAWSSCDDASRRWAARELGHQASFVTHSEMSYWALIKFQRELRIRVLDRTIHRGQNLTDSWRRSITAHWLCNHWLVATWSCQGECPTLPRSPAFVLYKKLCQGEHHDVILLRIHLFQSRQKFPANFHPEPAGKFHFRCNSRTNIINWNFYLLVQKVIFSWCLFSIRCWYNALIHHQSILKYKYRFPPRNVLTLSLVKDVKALELLNMKREIFLSCALHHEDGTNSSVVCMLSNNDSSCKERIVSSQDLLQLEWFCSGNGKSVVVSLPLKRHEVVLDLQWLHEQWWDLCFAPPPMDAINQVRTKVNPLLRDIPPPDMPLHHWCAPHTHLHAPIDVPPPAYF